MNEAAQREAREANQRLVRAYAQLVTVLAQLPGRLTQRAPLRTPAVRRAVQLVFEEAFDREWLLVALARLPRGSEELARRQAAVAAYVLVMTRRLLLQPADTVELCVAALFHDLSRLPGEPVPASGAGLRSGVRAAADVLCDEVCQQAAVALECFGPAAEAGPAARFIAVASLFEELTQPGPGRPPAATNEVMRLLNQLAGTRLDPSAVELFVRTLGFFPPGTVVRLTDDTLGLVTHPPAEQAQLDQPTVRPLDAAGHLSPTDLALGGHSTLAVKEAVALAVNPLRPWLD